jgi:hypothetical protein
MMKITQRRVTMAITAALTMGTVGLTAADAASAAHTHSKATGNESCVLLAQNGGEKDVILPNATGAENRRHPLHVNVHLGEPGTGGHIQIGVAGTASDPCYDPKDPETPIDYLND